MPQCQHVWQLCHVWGCVWRREKPAVWQRHWAPPLSRRKPRIRRCVDPEPLGHVWVMLLSRQPYQTVAPAGGDKMGTDARHPWWRWSFHSLIAKGGKKLDLWKGPWGRTIHLNTFPPTVIKKTHLVNVCWRGSIFTFILQRRHGEVSWIHLPKKKKNLASTVWSTSQSSVLLPGMFLAPYPMLAPPEICRDFSNHLRPMPCIRSLNTGKHNAGAHLLHRHPEKRRDGALG